MVCSRRCLPVERPLCRRHQVSVEVQALLDGMFASRASLLEATKAAARTTYATFDTSLPLLTNFPPLALPAPGARLQTEESERASLARAVLTRSVARSTIRDGVPSRQRSMCNSHLRNG